MPTRRMLTRAEFARLLGQHLPEAELACCADTRRLYGPHAACTMCGTQPSGH